MNKNKIYIVLIVSVFVFFIVMFALFGVDNLRKNSYNTTLIVGDNTVWVNKKNNWFNITGGSSLSDLNWDKYNVYINNEKLGDYLLWHNDKWYAFDDKKNAIDLDGGLFAYKANHKVSVYKFIEEEITDTDVVKQVLSENNLDENSKFTVSYKVSFDYDNDKEIEDFYLISNVFPSDFDPEYIFSIVFMVDEDNIYPIYTDISKNTYFNGCKPYFTSFLDVDSDKRYELILSCSRYSVSDSIDMLYQFSDDQFKILVSSQ